MKRLSLLPALLATWFLLGGCTSYDAQIERSHNFNGVQRFFVVANLNDNHGLDHLITRALTARGFTVESGPLTMMPDGTQAIVGYQDHWTWDFGDHLVNLQLFVRDPKSSQPYATANFGAKVPAHKTTDAIVDELVAKLFAPRKN